MAEQKPINPWVKTGLELGPVLGFFIVYMRIKDEVYPILGQDYSGFIVATVGFIPILLLSIAILWKLTGKLSRMQIMTAVLVIVFGGLTVIFNDEAFFKIKTTIVYGMFAAILGVGLLRGQSYLAFVMEDLMPIAQEGWMLLTKRLAAMFAAMAGANEIVWRTMSTEFWVKFETFALPAALFAFFIAQAKMLERYSLEKKGPEA
ncbi:MULTISPECIES: inner membrane-spanning protein YciB [Dinoroseobacter]|nr:MULTISPECIES: inner membrane-spanning protein YciB [Dinoroseobacter]MDD9717581.1 septation protein IspZ [Dinoroseobacter sp. PD6]URF45882.1 septation protein IspZ [Dinoroseobacter shibae]URF50189.1 septation protein IspZ [Dinoroseobacter shibae]